MSSSPARFPEKGPFLSKQWSSGSLMRGLSFLNDQKEKEKLEYGDILAVPKLPIYNIYFFVAIPQFTTIQSNPLPRLPRRVWRSWRMRAQLPQGHLQLVGRHIPQFKAMGLQHDTPQKLATPLDKSPKFDKDWYRWKTLETLSTFRWCFVSIPLGSPPLPMHATCAGCPGSRRAGGCPKRPWWAHGWWGGSTNISHICMYIIVYIHI